MNTHRRPIRPRDPGDQYTEVTERMDLGEAGRFAKQRFPMPMPPRQGKPANVELVNPMELE